MEEEASLSREQREIKKELTEWIARLVDDQKETWKNEHALETYQEWITRHLNPEAEIAPHETASVAHLKTRSGKTRLVHEITGIEGVGGQREEARRNLEEALKKHLEKWQSLNSPLETLQETVEEARQNLYQNQPEML